MKNENVLEYIEKRLGRKIDEEEKLVALECQERIKLSKQILDKKQHKVFKKKPTAKRSFYLRYMVASLVAIILCLSIVLPLTLNNNTPEQRIFIGQDVSREAILQSDLRSEYGLLLFSPEQMPLWTDYSSDSYREFVESPPTMLGYIIRETGLMLNNTDFFFITYRIRTFRYYHFEEHFLNRYSALELASAQSSGNNPVTYTIFETRDGVTRETLVNAFTIDDIRVFTFIHFDIDTGITTASIFFSFAGNDYFIRLTDVNPVNLLTTAYLETVVMRSLLDAPRGTGLF